ncbi:hypothetical protein Vretimale_15793 [Volvox reticuliferus]|uniref:Uncharacterized protein n=1 Tax=Volvox reticuliferus TaxID=1737510 RepID=A0A8J4D2T7_9CHLO|nr:hypothetical protein Vretifemale_18483 [Volvox reticuliferus]GIM12446.1 hypothetical protein Vretimale_15793 [Volvox reticuliferus]
MAVSVLKIEIDELKNSIKHLERSNRELKELLQTDGDLEYRIAIGENITTIAKKRARVAALEEELRRLAGEEYEHDAVAVPVCDEASSDQADDAEASGAVTHPGANDMQNAASQVVPRAEQPASCMELGTAAGGDGIQRIFGAAQFDHRTLISNVGAAARRGVEAGAAPEADMETVPAARLESADTAAGCSGTTRLSSGLWL